MGLPQQALEITDMLSAAGYESYFVGGCVRDMLMRRQPHDFDIATSAAPVQTLEVFKDFTCYRQGERFGTVGVLHGKTVFEITTFRSDGSYFDARHPQDVSFCGTIEQDLARRDFTVNSIAYSPRFGFIDPFGGKKDIAGKLIRATGEPDLRFSEDALRILRLFRFCAKLGFEAEPDTLAAAVKMRGLISKVAAERISSELCGIIEADPSQADRMVRLKILEALTLTDIYSDILTKKLPEGLELRLACLCLATKTDPQTLNDRLRLSNAVFVRCKAFYERIVTGPPKDLYSLKTVLQPLCFDDWRAICTVYNALGRDGGGLLKLVNTVEAENQPYRMDQLAIGGDDLAAAGYKGRQIGIILQACLELVRRSSDKNDKITLLKYADTCKSGQYGIE